MPTPLVLLHAFPLSSVMWERLAPLVTDREVVAVDLPGLGGSPAPADEPSMQAMATLVLEALDARDLTGPATFFGISTGGYVALEIAALAPERVDGLVLGSTTCWLVEPDLPETRRDTAAQLEAAGTVEPVLDPTAGLGETALREQPDLEPLLREVIEAGDPHGIAWTARAIAAREDRSELLAGLDRPVLLLFGAEDTETAPSRGEAMRDLRPEHLPTSLVVLEGTGHLTALEQPLLVSAHLHHWATTQGGPVEATGS